MPVLLLVEFGTHEEGDAPFRAHIAPTLEAVRAMPGCLEATVYERPQRLYLFYSVWTDRPSIEAWVQDPYHRGELMPGFRRWCTEGWFSYWDLADDRNRARKCPQCGRWTQAMPGWTESNPSSCRNCGAALGDRHEFDGGVRHIEAAPGGVEGG